MNAVGLEKKSSERVAIEKGGGKEKGAFVDDDEEEDCSEL